MRSAGFAAAMAAAALVVGLVSPAVAGQSRNAAAEAAGGRGAIAAGEGADASLLYQCVDSIAWVKAEGISAEGSRYLVRAVWWWRIEALWWVVEVQPGEGAADERAAGRPPDHFLDTTDVVADLHRTGGGPFTLTATYVQGLGIDSKMMKILANGTQQNYVTDALGSVPMVARPAAG